MSDYNDVMRTIKYLETLSKEQLIEYVSKALWIPFYIKPTEREPIDIEYYKLPPRLHTWMDSPMDFQLPKKNIYCQVCNELLNSFPNERKFDNVEYAVCEQTWLETGNGNYCFDCFVREDKEAFSDSCETLYVEEVIARKKIHKDLNKKYGL